MKKTYEEVIAVNDLLAVYGPLLTKRQQRIMHASYALDLSLSEIAEELSISRAAVSDALGRSLVKLNGYEEKLGICRAFKKLKDTADPQRAALIKELKELIEHGL